MTRGSGKPTKLCCIVSLTNDVAHWSVLPHPRRLVPQPTSPTNGLSGTAPWIHLDCRADQARPSHVFLVCRPSKLVPLTIVQVRLVAYDLAGRLWFFFLALVFPSLSGKCGALLVFFPRENRPRLRFPRQKKLASLGYWRVEVVQVRLVAYDLAGRLWFFFPPCSRSTPMLHVIYRLTFILYILAP